MLIWDTIEVGRNDAANIVNAVFGSRILTRQNAVRLSGIGVVAGACLSSAVIDTARKGIFTPSLFTVEQALAIYTSVYVVDTILLYSYSAFGMPVSTTMTLVFELLGASLFLGLLRDTGSINAVKWASAGTVLLGIVCSIALSGVMGFFLQRAARGAIREKWSSFTTLLLHGGWVGGGLMAGLCYFMMVKGGKEVSVIRQLEAYLERKFPGFSVLFSILVLWVFFAILIHVSLVVFRKKAAKRLFPILTVLGMLSMAFAFGQNDLANCASPGLAAIALIHGHLQGMTVAEVTKVPISTWTLFVCGVLLVVGMATRNATRVTRAEVRTGSSGDHVKLWAPGWCVKLAGHILRRRNCTAPLAPPAARTPEGKTQHYDPLRACIIVCVSASVIATASSLALPVSTTYVAFAAVVATGMADRIFARGDAELKLGRSIWVVTSWFLAALMATVITGVVCVVVYYVGAAGMAACVAANLVVRHYVKRRADAQEERVRQEAVARMRPDEYDDETHG